MLRREDEKFREKGKMEKKSYLKKIFHLKYLENLNMMMIWKDDKVKMRGKKKEGITSNATHVKNII